MRAARNTRYGSPTVLSVADVDRPTAGPKEILVEVHAAGVTQGDRRLRAADFPGISAWIGRPMVGIFVPRHHVGGSVFAGRVVAIGSDVSRFRVGDDVFGSVMHGAYAQYLAVKENEGVAKMPASTSYAEAAAIPYGGVTALAFLRDMAKVQPGERVLIVGASGGVGRLAVQVSKRLGAEVTGVCHRGQDRVRALGADDVIDYRAEDFTERGQQWDVIFDTTQGDHFRHYRKALTKTGRYLSVYVTPRILFEMLLTSIRKGPRAIAGVAMPTPKLMDDLRELVDAGALCEPIAQRFPLSRIVDAHEAVDGVPPFGSVIVDIVEAQRPPLERIA